MPPDAYARFLASLKLAMELFKAMILKVGKERSEKEERDTKAEKANDQIANCIIVLPGPGDGAIWVLA